MKYFKLDKNYYVDEKDSYYCAVPKCVFNIKQALMQAKEEKEDFKTLILKFDKLSSVEKLRYIHLFYRLDTGLLSNVQLEKIQKECPVCQVIKTEFEGSDGGKILATVYAKPNTKFKLFGAYKKSQLEQLAAEGNYIILSEHAEYTHRPDNIFYGTDLLDKSFDQVLIDEDVYKQMQTQNPEVVEAMMADINLEDIKQDYQTKYLPYYKQCLKTLLTYARQTVAFKNEEIKRSQQRQEQLQKEKQQMEEYAKQIEDAAKGR